MIAINTNHSNEDDFEREIVKLEAQRTDALNRKAELQEQLDAIEGIIDSIQATSDELKRRREELKRLSPTRFVDKSAKDALLTVMRENSVLHWQKAHRLIVAGGCDVSAATIKAYLADGWRYENDWGTGCYHLLW